MIDWGYAFSLISPSAVLFSALLGLMIGAFYGYPLNSEDPPSFPWSMWVVGNAFIVGLAVWTSFNEITRVETQFLRILLWAVTCLGIPLGRYLRIKLDIFRVRRKRESLPGPEAELVEGGDDQHEGV